MKIQYENFNVTNSYDIGLYPLVINKSLFFDFQGIKTAEFLVIKTFKLVFLRLLLEERISIKKEFYNPKFLFWQEHIKYTLIIIKDELIEDKLSRVILSIIKVKGEISLNELIDTLLVHFLGKYNSSSTFTLFIYKYLAYYTKEKEFLAKDNSLSFWKKLFAFENILIDERVRMEYYNKFKELEKTFYKIRKNYIQYKLFDNDLEELIKTKFYRRDND